jgi:hypothetical protein
MAARRRNVRICRIVPGKSGTIQEPDGRGACGIDRHLDQPTVTFSRPNHTPVESAVGASP